ncbi:ATP synthase mitochondrial F1 complex assembly factor 2 [Pseudocyphellaria aurata]|nr:ATP synthase mitochondrial F1 complex assembly factor 2 [Pseudocyphellaria aurata]
MPLHSLVEGTHEVYLDSRPLRNPSTKKTLAIPSSKPHLATAIALEWDLLTSIRDTLRTHLLPLTSIASRAHDMLVEESPDGSARSTKTRKEIVTSLLRYLNTDTLLCWDPHEEDAGDVQDLPSLRHLQIRTALPIIDFLTTHIWPGVELVPSLKSNSIHPVDQPREVQDIIKSWMFCLSPWDLAGLERATLAGKSLLVGARLLVEWSESFRGSQEWGSKDERSGAKFGIEAAAEACSLEVRWQTGRWGEVEDSHDVEREDLKRQFGSVVLVVGGTGG